MHKYQKLALHSGLLKDSNENRAKLEKCNMLLFSKKTINIQYLVDTGEIGYLDEQDREFLERTPEAIEGINLVKINTYDLSRLKVVPLQVICYILFYKKLTTEYKKRAIRRFVNLVKEAKYEWINAESIKIVKHALLLQMKGLDYLDNEFAVIDTTSIKGIQRTYSHDNISKEQVIKFFNKMETLYANMLF